MTSTVQIRDEKLIRQLLAEREAAMRAGDAELIVSQYAPGAVTFDLAPPLRHQGAEVHDPSGLREWFAGFGGSIGYEMGELDLTVGGDVAFCHSLNRMGTVGTPGAAESPAPRFELWFRATVCLRRVDGQWRISHEHTSTPFHMDGSFLAATDLRP